MPTKAKAATAPANGKFRLDMLKAHQTYTNAAGERLPGVTTILGCLAKPALIPWAWGLGAKGIKLEAARQLAADIGTVGHALVEAHLRGLEFDSANIAPEMLAKAETSFIRFLEYWDREHLTVIASEMQMVSEIMQVGGTVDIVAARPDGSLVVIDVKTGKGLYPEMLVQAAVYAAIYTEVTGCDVAEVVVVRIPKEDDDGLEIRTVSQRAERVAAFHALANTRQMLHAVGMKV